MRRRGLTLIELLVVAFILVLFVAVAAPLLRPNTEAQKIREAARLVNTYITEAKAYAAQRNHPVSVVFDRDAATKEAARDSNIVTRLYIAESPPIYSGDVLGATVAVWHEPTQPAIPGFTPPAINGNNPRLLTLDFRYGGAGMSAMLDVITKSYFPSTPNPGDSLPLKIRFKNKGPWYPGLAMYSNATPPGIPGRTLQFFALAQFGQQMHTANVPNLPNPYPSGPTMLVEYEVLFPPQITTASPLELPTGTAIDLQFSGMGTLEQFFDSTRSSTASLGVVFNPSGEVEGLQVDRSATYPMGRMYFLVGSAKRAVDTTDATNPANRDVTASNLANPESYWVSVSARTGRVGTAENASYTVPAVPQNDPTYWPSILGQARVDAINSKDSTGR